MTQFQHTLKQLLAGEKTETSRIALPEPDGTGTFDCEMIGYPLGIPTVKRYLPGWNKWRTIWQVGKDYAIVPRRGVHSVGRYQIENLWRQDVRTLTLNQLQVEGMEEPEWFNFIQLWASMHDKSFKFQFDPRIVDYRVSIARQYKDTVGWDDLKAIIENRPTEYYQAWRMTISVLWETVDWDAPAVRALQIEPHPVN